MRVTIATPLSLIDAANELALVLGKSPADRKTFSRLTHEDEIGNFYSVVSLVAQPTFASSATNSLKIPHFAKNVNMTLAETAQESLVIHTENSLQESSKATENTITAYISNDVNGSINAMRLKSIQKPTISEEIELPYSFDYYNANTEFYFGNTFDTSYPFDNHNLLTGLYYGYYEANSANTILE